MANTSLQDIGGLLNVSRGTVIGATRIQKTAFNPNVGTSEESIWNESGTVVTYPASATTMTVSSSSSSDTAAGTGARTITVSGLDSNYLPISETVTLNGQSAVTTTNAYLRMNILTVITAGSGGVNAGIIYIGTGNLSAGKPAVVYSSIGTGFNRSQQGFYTVPGNQTGYFLRQSATTNVANTETRLWTRSFGGLFTLVRINEVSISGFNRDFRLPLVLPAKTDLDFRALNVTGSTKVTGAYEILLVSAP